VVGGEGGEIPCKGIKRVVSPRKFLWQGGLRENIHGKSIRVTGGSSSTSLGGLLLGGFELKKRDQVTTANVRCVEKGTQT